MCHIRSTIRARFESPALAPTYSCRLPGNYEKRCFSRISLLDRTVCAPYRPYGEILCSLIRLRRVVSVWFWRPSPELNTLSAKQCNSHTPSQPALQQRLSPHGSTERPAGGTRAQHRPGDRILVDPGVSSVWRHVALCQKHIRQRRRCDRILGDQWRLVPCGGE